LKHDIIEALKASAEPLDRTAISSLCLSGTNEQIADQLYLMKKAGTIIGEKQRGGTFLYRMPTESEGDVLRRAVAGMVAVGDKTDATKAVLSMRSEAEVDEIDLERIEEATAIVRMVEEVSDEPKKLPPRDVIERMIAERPGDVEVPSDDILEEPAENGKRHMDVWPGPTLAERMADPKGTIYVAEAVAQPESAERTGKDATEAIDQILDALDHEPSMLSVDIVDSCTAHGAVVKAMISELEKTGVLVSERVAGYVKYRKASAAERHSNGGIAYMQDQPESDVSETVEDETEEPIKQEVPPFRVGVYSDETMVLEKPDEDLYEIDKAEFAVLVAFARTVGWLPE